MATTKPNTVDEYIAGYPEAIQKFLTQIRTAIKKAAPKAEESIAYNMPMYKWNGTLLSFAAWKNHLALYPAPTATGEFKKKLKPYEGAKATLRFSFDQALSSALIAKIVKLMMKENRDRANAKAKKKKLGTS